MGHWSDIQLSFTDRSCYTLQHQWRKLTQFRQIDELFASQSVRSSSLLSPSPISPSFSLAVSSIVSSSAILRFQSSSSSTNARSTTLFNLQPVVSSIPRGNFCFAGHFSSPGDSSNSQPIARLDQGRANQRAFPLDQMSTKEIVAE